MTAQPRHPIRARTWTAASAAAPGRGYREMLRGRTAPDRARHSARHARGATAPAARSRRVDSKRLCTKPTSDGAGQLGHAAGGIGIMTAKGGGQAFEGRHDRRASAVTPVSMGTIMTLEKLPHQIRLFGE